MSDKWQPSKEDIGILCDSILCGYIAENHNNSADYCIHCHKEYGNVKLNYHDLGKKEPHEKDCPVLIAEDVMTGFKD
jgi:hypothetical protein